MDTEPRTLLQFCRWLETACDNVNFQARYVEPDYLDRLEIEQTIDTASRLARRLGAGDLAPASGPMTINEALAALGALLAWARRQTATPPGVLSVGTVAEMLGVSTRSVWRMVSAGEIPSPVKVGGLTKWRRADIEATIDLLPTVKG